MFPRRAGRSINPGEFRFRPAVVGVVNERKESQPKRRSEPPRVVPVICPSLNLSGTGQRRWGFHTVRGDISTRGISVSVVPFVGVLNARKESRTNDGVLSSPGCAGSMSEPPSEPQPIGDGPAALAFPQCPGWCRSGRISFRSDGY